MYYSNEGIRLQHSSYENIIVTDWNKLEMILIKKWVKECNNFHQGKIDNQGISKNFFWLPDERPQEAGCSNAFWYFKLGTVKLLFYYFIKWFNFRNHSKVLTSSQNFSKVPFSFHKSNMVVVYNNEWMFCMHCWL